MPSWTTVGKQYKCFLVRIIVLWYDIVFRYGLYFLTYICRSWFSKICWRFSRTLYNMFHPTQRLTDRCQGRRPFNWFLIYESNKKSCKQWNFCCTGDYSGDTENANFRPEFSMDCCIMCTRCAKELSWWKNRNSFSEQYGHSFFTC